MRRRRWLWTAWGLTPPSRRAWARSRSRARPGSGASRLSAHMSGSIGLWRLAVCFVVVAAACGAATRTSRPKTTLGACPKPLRCNAQRLQTAPETPRPPRQAPTAQSLTRPPTTTTARPVSLRPRRSVTSGRWCWRSSSLTVTTGAGPSSASWTAAIRAKCLGAHVALIAGPTTTLAAQPAGEPCQAPAAGGS